MDHPEKGAFSLKPRSFGLGVHRRWNFPTLQRDQRGAVAVITALALTVLIGLVGLALDVGMWYRTNRALQNAADAAVIAAAINGTSSYQAEAKAVAAQYGFVDGADDITVTALNNQTCPSGSTDCYKVTVARSSPPKFFSPVLGTFNPALAGAAMASNSGTHSYCLLALATSGTSPAIQANGAQSTDFTGCSVMSNSGATCNGGDLKATYGDAHGTNNGCGVTRRSNMPTVADPYSSLASNIPSNPCSSYSQIPSHTHDPALSTVPLSGANIPNALSAAPTVAATWIVCGDLQLQANVTLTTASPGSVLVIENGILDTNRYTLKTTSGSALTIIFSGPSGSYNHYPTDTNGNLGTLDFMAPTSGTWGGIALYQNPALTSGVSFTYAGNNPTWKVTGVTYFPHASVAFKGAVNKSSFGASCFLLVVDNVTISGTGDIAETGGCAAAGITLPTNNVGGIALVM
jgi:Flp pilus assembly protein TadG